MTPSRDEIRSSLERLTPPEPRPEFVERLAHRLQAMDQQATGRHVPVFRRPPAFGFVALGALTVVMAVLLAVLPRDADDRRLDVTGQAPAARPEQDGQSAAPGSTTTEPPASTGTTVPGQASNRPTTTTSAGTDRSPVPQLPPAPVTTPGPTATTRPRTAPTTTTTTAPAQPETLALTCVAGQPGGSPGVQCDWSQSTSPTFYAYRLWRATGADAKQSIYAVSNRATTSYIDRPAAGVHHYMVEAVDTGNRVSGRSAIVEVTCC